MVDLFYCGFSDNVSYQDLFDNPGKLAKAPFLPFDGVNEKGVAISLMAVPYAEPPYDAGKVDLYDLALIRLVLDYAENTDHAIELLSKYNYKASDPPVHFLIADKQGNAAVIEYVQNDMKISRNTEPYLVSTNFIVYNSGAPLNVTCDRYKKAYSTLSQNSGIISKTQSIELLNNVSQDITMWSLVYNLSSFDNISVAVGRNFNNVYSFKK
jgi:penicillin V acylase-like amidase (Ntn superfamily)